MTLRSGLRIRTDIIAASLFFLGVFVINSGSVTDGDFFWHLKTGEWIWQHKSLPITDPFAGPLFTDTTCLRHPDIISSLLRGYWLAQLIFFILWKWFGLAGIVFLRAAIYSGIIIFLYVWSKKKSGALIAFFMSVLPATLFTDFPNERPQIFTFLFIPVTIYLLERARIDTSHRMFEKRDLLLPLVTLTWSNMHGGYVLGIAIIGAYVTGEFINRLIRGKVPVRFRIITSGFMAILLSCMNPSFYQMFLVSAGAFNDFTGSIQEFMSPFAAAVRLGEFYWPYFIFLAAALFIIVWRIRVMEPAHIMTLLLLAGLSVSGLRFMPYLLMTGPVLCNYIPKRQFRYESVFVLLCALVWAALPGQMRISRALLDESFPAGAVQFIRDKRPASGIFNYYGWGGFLIYSIPEYPVFIDGRQLNICADKAYETALWQDGWGKVFLDNDINTVIMPGMSLVSGEVYPLIFNLMLNNEWFLVYRDEWSLVFVKNSPGSREIIEKYAMKKELMFRHILAAATNSIRKNPDNPGFWRARAVAHSYLGEFADAISDYRSVLKLDPKDVRALKALKDFGQTP